MKRAATTIAALLIVAVVGIMLVDSVMANPFTNSQYKGKTGAPSDAPKPTISIFYPENNKAYDTNSITLNFNASVEKISEMSPYQVAVSGMRIIESFFTADWLPNQTPIDIAPYLNVEGGSNTLSVSLNLTGVPDGKHVLRVFVLAEGIIIDPLYWYNFEKVGYSRVDFSVDTTLPSVSVSPIVKEIHVQSEPLEVPLNFTLSESVVKISYVLDGIENVTIDGKITLSGLSYGEHCLKVYAWDAAGNVGVSETITFNVAEPFSAALVAAASGTSITVIGVGLLVYFKKRQRGKCP